MTVNKQYAQFPLENAFIDRPLVLVSQIQRSGGSMMAQLFDGHPELFAHPFEIHIGHPNKWNWPALNLSDDPNLWFDQLFEAKVLKFIQEGYAKPGSNKFARQEKFPFTFSIQDQRAFFLEAVRARSVASVRDILDCYFSAFFFAWKDYQPSGKEKFVTGFTPRVNLYPESREGFFRDYPDGKMISIVRDPISWFSSTHKHNANHADVRIAIEEWALSIKAIQNIRQSHPEQSMAITYEGLLRSPELTMRKVADFMGIEYQDILLKPTYLSNPVRPNSSYSVEQYGINPSMLDREHLLNEDQKNYIHTHAMPLYEALTKV